jgi:hypothetical protein
MRSPDTVRQHHRVEVGGSVHPVVEMFGGDLVVRLDGELSRSTAAGVARTLVRLLHGGEPVLADLSTLACGWARAVELFPSALQVAGGWPAARLVLFGADAALTAALRAARVPERVPLVADRAAARAHGDVRPEEVQRHVDLTEGLTAGPSARAAVIAACQEWRVPHVAATAALIANELVINAVAHARSAPQLTICLRSSDVTVNVRDQLRCPDPRPQLRSVDRPGGWGLLMVTALARRWGVIGHDDGKTVWATVSTTEPEPSPTRPGPGRGGEYRCDGPVRAVAPGRIPRA